MRARSFSVGLATVFMTLSVASADPRGDIDKKIKQAMESYDSMDYDAAKKLLNQALAAAKKSKLDKDQVTAKAYLDLGIIAFVNNDADSAKLSFLSAVQIQPKIQIDPAYKSPEMAKLLEEARGEVKGGGGGAGTVSVGGGGGEKGEPSLDLSGGGDCTGVKGLDHQLVESGKANAPLTIEARVGSDVKAAKISVMFRPEHATDFIELKMSKQGDCKYTATIPASGTKGTVVHYYVAAYGDGPKPIISKGSAGSPNIVELSGGGGGAAKSRGGDDEDPINGGKTKPQPVAAATPDGDSGGDVSKGTTTTGTKQPHIMIAIAGGGGFGYLSGTTEAANPVKSSGFSPNLVVLQPELAYMVSPQVSIGVAVRLGFPLGANVDGHATLGPAGIARLRYALDPSGEGVHVMGQLGVGIIRSTLNLDNAMSGQNTDVVAQGPLLLGGGAGYTKKLSGNVMFLADVSLLAGINVGGADAMGNSSVTGAPLNSGLTVDMSIGLALGL